MNCPPLVSGVLTPKIYWYQTDLQIVLRIMLHDVDKYFISVQTDHFQFSTILNDTKYYVCMSLFGAVIAEETEHENKGRELKIWLNKVQKGFLWLRLHLEDCKWPQIFPDPDHLESTNRFEKFKYTEREDFSIYKKRHNITKIMPDVPSSDEEDSDDAKYNVMFE